MFLEPVVIAGDHACPDIHVFADGCVADIGEVVRLAPFADDGLLDLDEISYLHTLADHRTRPQMNKGAHRRAAGYAALFDDRAVFHRDPAADGAVHDSRAWIDGAGLAEAGLAFEPYVRVENGVAAERDVAADKDRAGIKHGDAFQHPLAVDPALHDPFGPAQVIPCVHTHDLIGVAAQEGGHAALFFARQGDGVGKIIFSLDIFPSDPVEGGEEERLVKTVDAGVHFMDLSLRRRSVLLLHHAHHAGLAANNSSISERVGRLGGHERNCRA